VAVVQREWFAMSSNKLSTVMQVESMLTCVRDVSQTLLEHVVNMADNNVRHATSTAGSTRNET